MLEEKCVEWCGMISFQDSTPDIWSLLLSCESFFRGDSGEKIWFLDMFLGPGGSTPWESEILEISSGFWHWTFGGFLSHGGTPSHHPFWIGIFPYKPSSYWGIPIYGYPLFTVLIKKNNMHINCHLFSRAATSPTWDEDSLLLAKTCPTFVGSRPEMPKSERSAKNNGES